MTDAASSNYLTPLGAEAASDQVMLAAVIPAGYAAPAHLMDPSHPDEVSALAQLAEQVLQDPLAVKRLGDRVVELLKRDLELQRERSRGHGRRY